MTTKAATAYPLQWPDGWPRTTTGRRVQSRYRVSEGRARDEMLHSLKRFGAEHIVLSTNVKLSTSGLPLTNQRRPDDTGVAVYWVKNGQPMCIACDVYVNLGDNYRDIFHAIEALRALERVGSSQIQKRAFQAFAVLPAAKPQRHWREVMEFSYGAPVDVDVLTARWRSLSRSRHPDSVGGSHEAMVELNRARDDAMREMGVM